MRVEVSLYFRNYPQNLQFLSVWLANFARNMNVFNSDSVSEFIIIIKAVCEKRQGR
jgi:hypothetical protein